MRAGPPGREPSRSTPNAERSVGEAQRGPVRPPTAKRSTASKSTYHGGLCVCASESSIEASNIFELHADRLDDLVARHNAGEEVGGQRRGARTRAPSSELSAGMRAATGEHPLPREIPAGLGRWRRERAHQRQRPDLYEPNGRDFLRDLYAAQLKNEPEAQERSAPPALRGGEAGGHLGHPGRDPAAGVPVVELYAKASRGGRVFANEVNNGPLPDVGMTVILPRLTQGLAAAAQATQNTAVVTQDPTETESDGGNGEHHRRLRPGDRQGIERARTPIRSCSRDLTARYWSALNSCCLNGTGSNNQPFGLLREGPLDQRQRRRRP